MSARGYFGIGVEGISKPMNFGNLARSAHGFGASFIFTVAAGKIHQGAGIRHHPILESHTLVQFRYGRCDAAA